MLVSRGATREIDLAFTQLLQMVASGPLDLLANVNTLFGQASVTTALAALLAIAAWRREPRWAWLAAGLFVIAAGAGVALKLVLVHAPPPPEYVRAWWNPLGVQFATPSGFPSGHVARVTFLALFAMGLTRSAGIRIALLALIAYTFWARVYIGDHWVSDAIGGLALGVATGCAALAWVLARAGRAQPSPAEGPAQGRVVSAHISEQDDIAIAFERETKAVACARLPEAGGPLHAFDAQRRMGWIAREAIDRFGDPRCLCRRQLAVRALESSGAPEDHRRLARAFCRSAINAAAERNVFTRPWAMSSDASRSPACQSSVQKYACEARSRRPRPRRRTRRPCQRGRWHGSRPAR